MEIKISKRHKILGVFSLISVLFLIIFITLKCLDFSGLQLEEKWLFVSGIPIIVGLFWGGFIKTFKGLGLEIEASLNKELPDNLISSITQNTIVDTQKIEKKAINDLERLTKQELENISRIRFIYNRKGYEPYVVGEYFRHLKKLKYVEIVDAQNKFQFLIPISKFKINSNILPIVIEDFIDQINKATLNSSFPGAITTFVSKSESVMDAYRKLMSNTQKIETKEDTYLPVLDSDHRLIGMLSKNKVEEYISKEVLNNYEKNGS